MTHDDIPDNLERQPRLRRPRILPSYDVHIVPTRNLHGTAMWSGPDHWITEGYELRRLISMLYDIPATRIEFTTLDPYARYDVAVVLPHEEDSAVLLDRIKRALECDLHLVVSKVMELRPVYVVTAPDGPGKMLVSACTPGGGFIATRTSMIVPKTASPSKEMLQEMINRTGTFVDSLSMCGSVSDLCMTIEDWLGRPVIDETSLEGYFELQFTRGDMTHEQVFEHLSHAFGLVLAPQTRNVVSLRVQPR